MPNRPRLLITVMSGLIASIEGDSSINILIADHDIKDDNPKYGGSGIYLEIDESAIHVHSNDVELKPELIDDVFTKYSKELKKKSDKILGPAILFTEEYKTLDGSYSITVYENLTYELEGPHGTAGGRGVESGIIHDIMSGAPMDCKMLAITDDVAIWFYTIPEKLIKCLVDMVIQLNTVAKKVLATEFEPKTIVDDTKT